MFALYKKELKQFLANTSGYVVISLFLVFCSLYLFFFEGEFNILNSEFASLEPFFIIAPWALILMIPALTMRSFAEEKQLGTIELLFTQPLSKFYIIGAKYGSVLTVVLLALCLTVFYSYSVQQLIYLDKSLDWGIVFSSYFGLFLLSASFIAIGIFVSSLVKNMITAYLLTIFICFFVYFGFSNLASYNFFGTYDYWLDQFGFYSHYTTFTKGILSIKSLLFFLLVIFFFLGLTYFSLKSSSKKYSLLLFPILIAGLLFVDFGKIDLTHDKRYTLTDITKNIAKSIQKPIQFEVYLEGDFPSDLRIFKKEVKKHLDELRKLNVNIKFKFINPFIDKELLDNLSKQKITPITKRVQTDEGSQEFYIYPYAKVIYEGKQLIFPLIKDVNLPIEQNVESIEFNFTKALSEIVKTKKPKIGVFVHHNEFSQKEHQTFFSVLNNKYKIEPFLPDSKDVLTSEEAKKLNDYDALLVINPENKFTDTDREAVDQFIMNGGKILWLLDGVNTEIDSLYKTGKSTVVGKDLGLTQLLFKYGVRVNPNLIRDYSQSAKLSLITDEYNGKPVFTNFDWFYYPISNYSPTNHPIVENIAPVRFEFVSTIDTLNVPNIKKEVLLATSEKTSVQGTLSEVSLGMVDLKPNLSEFDKKNQVMAVLLEGKFTSAFKNRVHTFNFPNKEQSLETKMIVVADGDIAKNPKSSKIIGGDRTGKLYGNEDFLMNSIDYLLDKDHIFLLKNKTIDIKLLDPAKLQNNKLYWELMNLIIPLLNLWIIGMIFIYLHYKKYSK